MNDAISEATLAGRSVPVAATEVINAIPLAVLVLNDAGAVTSANPVAEELLQCAQTRLLKEGLGAALNGDEAVMRLLSRSAETGAPFSERDITLVLTSGRQVRVDAHVAPLPEADGCMVAVFEQRSAPTTLGRHFTAKGAAKSAYGVAAMLAHEIKNPLSSIRGASQLLQSHAKDDEDRELADLIREECDRIRRIIDRLDIFTDLRPIDRAPINIHEVLTHVRRVAETGFGRNVSFREEFDPSLPAAFGNREMLVQLFLNLVKNACEAVDEAGGEVALISAYRHGMRVKSKDDQAGTLIELPLMISVRDNGRGVPEGLREHLFDPFVTGREGGGGLGLAMAAKIVSDHRGVIECIDTGAGTRFDVLLPAASDQPGQGL